MKLQYKRHEIHLEVMDTPNKRSQGMMGRKNLNGGMLFIFPDVQELSFWMKNCLIPLDIIFIQNNTVTNIVKNAVPCLSECERYTGIGNKVLELKSGMVDRIGLNIGDEVSIV